MKNRVFQSKSDPSVLVVVREDRGPVLEWARVEDGNAILATRKSFLLQFSPVSGGSL